MQEEDPSEYVVSKWWELYTQCLSFNDVGTVVRKFRDPKKYGKYTNLYHFEYFLFNKDLKLSR